MKINDDHLYHGAVLTQVAEHPQFTAINAFDAGQGISRSAFLINHDVGVFLKYATKTKAPFSEYQFTFTAAHLKEIAAIQNKSKRVYIALVCVKDRQIGCISWDDLQLMINERKAEKGSKESAYTVLVVCPKGKKLRAYMNAPGARKKKLKEHLLSRSSFPGILFE